MPDEHPALAAGKKSVSAVMRGEKDEWLSLFTDDAVVQDPVGVSPLDPTGEGHKGKEAIAKFWDTIIAPGKVEVVVRESHPCGNECANVATITNTMDNGMIIKTDLVAVYKVNKEGKLLSIKAYWDYDKVAASMGG